MQPFEKIKEYTNTVCGQIRWKKAHAMITEEIENHLVDQRDAYIAEGEDEESATDKSILEMGDPAGIGNLLDRTHRPKPQWGMLALTVVLVCIGILIMRFFNVASYQWAINTLVLPSAGLALMAAVYFMDFTWIGRHPKRLYLILLILIAAYFVMRQMQIPWSMIYYEGVLPLLFPLGFAGVVYSARNKGCRGIILCGIAFWLPALLMLMMRFRTDFVLFAVSAFVTICIAISKEWFHVKKRNGYLIVLISVAIFITLAAVYIFQYSYRWEKILSAFGPSVDPHGEYSFGMHIKASLAGSKFIGQGVMPYAGAQEPGCNVFCLLTCLIYYTGWISFIPIMGVLLFFIVKGFRLCYRQKSCLALFVSVSVMMSFTMQTVVYVLFNLGFDLFAPISLPFIMQYDFAYFTNFALVGLMLSVFRTGYIVKDKNSNDIAKHSFITQGEKKLFISSGKK